MFFFFKVYMYIIVYIHTIDIYLILKFDSIDWLVLPESLGTILGNSLKHFCLEGNCVYF